MRQAHFAFLLGAGRLGLLCFLSDGDAAGNCFEKRKRREILTTKYTKHTKLKIIHQTSRKVILKNAVEQRRNEKQKAESGRLKSE
jgi:hypothetical protein